MFTLSHETTEGKKRELVLSSLYLFFFNGVKHSLDGVPPRKVLERVAQF